MIQKLLDAAEQVRTDVLILWHSILDGTWRNGIDEMRRERHVRKREERITQLERFIVQSPHCWDADSCDALRLQAARHELSALKAATAPEAM